MYPVSKLEKREKFKKNEEKWTKTLMDAGWTVIPDILLLRQKALNLDAIDINIILHLAMYWWEKDKPPFPSKQTIADCMQIDVSTVRRRIQDLEKEGLIKRRYRTRKDGGQNSNEYLFDGLIKAATPLAEAATELKRQQREERAATRRGKTVRSHLTAVEPIEED